MDNLVYFILLALIAEILGTVGGFGSSMFFVPLASFFLDFYTVLGVTALFHVASNISKIALFREGVDWKLVIRIGVPSILFVIAGALLSKYLNVKILEISLAIVLIGFSALMLLIKNVVVKPNRTNSFLGGSISGFVAGLVGTGGAVRGITLSAFNLPKNVFIATSALIDLGIDSSRAVVYFYNGYIHKTELYLAPLLLAVAIVGTYFGKKILQHISEKQFKGIVLLLILAIGMATLVRQINLL